MGKASSAKKVARAARAGGRVSSGQPRSLLFPSVLTLVARPGPGPRRLRPEDRRNDDLGGVPQLGDHIHQAIAVHACGQFLPDIPLFESPNIGIHTHADGVIHIHPFSQLGVGANATLERYFKDARDEGDLDVSLSNTKLDYLGETYEEGKTKCDGRRRPGPPRRLLEERRRTRRPSPRSPRATSATAASPRTAPASRSSTATRTRTSRSRRNAEQLAALGAADGGQVPDRRATPPPRRGRRSTRPPRVVAASRRRHHHHRGRRRDDHDRGPVGRPGHRRCRPSSSSAGSARGSGRSPSAPRSRCCPVGNRPMIERVRRAPRPPRRGPAVLVARLPARRLPATPTPTVAAAASSCTTPIEPEPRDTAGRHPLRGPRRRDRRALPRGQRRRAHRPRHHARSSRPTSAAGAEATIALHRVDDPSAFGVVPDRRPTVGSPPSSRSRPKDEAPDEPDQRRHLRRRAVGARPDRPRRAGQRRAGDVPGPGRRRLALRATTATPTGSTPARRRPTWRPTSTCSSGRRGAAGAGGPPDGRGGRASWRRSVVGAERWSRPAPRSTARSSSRAPCSAPARSCATRSSARGAVVGRGRGGRGRLGASATTCVVPDGRAPVRAAARMPGRRPR